MVVAVVVAGLLAAGWGAALLFQSPEQVEADRQAPEVGPVTAPVTRGDLAESITVAMNFQREKQVDIPLVPASPREVVTRAPVGSDGELGYFTVLTEVNGRPRFVVGGDFPFYRDLQPGDSGPDVLQLQKALATAGFMVSPDGRFGNQTAVAMRSIYKNSGYGSPVVSAEPDSTGATPAAVFTIPVAELIVTPQMPARLLTTLPVGSILNAESRISVGFGGLVASAEVDAAIALQLKPEMEASLSLPNGTNLSATISDVHVVPLAEDAAEGAAETWLVAVKPNDDQVAPVMGQATVAAITLQLAATDSLLVPTIAVIPAGGANPHVLVQQIDGDFRSVEVRETAALGGRSAIEPIDEGAVNPGDLVRVG